MDATLDGSSSSGIWTTSGSGTFANPDDEDPVYTPSAADISNGSVILTLTTDDATSPCNNVFDSMVLTIRDQIVITTQPQNVGVCGGNSASFSAVVVGDDLSYQWYKGIKPGGTAVSGATSNVLNFPSTILSDAGNYYLRITSAYCDQVDSNNVTLNVNQQVAITTQPQSQVECEGDGTNSVTFSVVATGTVQTYQWYFNNSSNPVGSNSASYTDSSVTLADAGNYYVVITSPGGTCSAITSATAVLTVNPNPTAIISYAGSPFCSSDSSLQNVTLTGTYAYTGGTYSAPAGLTINSSTGAITPSSSTPGSYTVTYTIPAIAGCSVVTATANVIISPNLTDAIIDGFACDQATPPVCTSPNSSQIIACHQGTGELTLHIDATYAPYVMGWEYNNGVGWMSIPGTAGSLTYNFIGLLGATGYRAVIDTGGCGIVYSDGAFVSVIPIDLIPEPVTASPTAFCLGGASTMTASSNYGAELLNQDGGFDQGQLNTNDPDGWLVDGELGKLSASGNSVTPNNWSVTNDGKTYNGITYDNDNPSPFIDNKKFAIAYGYYNSTGVGGHPVIYDPITGYRITTMETPIFSLLTLQNATLDFREAYSLLPGSMCYTNESLTTQEMAPDAEAIIEISLDGGVTYTEFLRPTISATAQTPANYQDFADVSLDLSDYFGQTDVRIRFTFVRNCTSSWAIDGISLPGGTPGSTIEWTDQFGVFVSNDNTVVYPPITPGYQIYHVKTLINGCEGGSEDVPLTVDLAYATSKLKGNACGDGIQLYAYDNTKSAYTNYLEFGFEGLSVNGIYTVPANPSFDYLGTGATGEWSIAAGPQGPNPANYANLFYPSIDDPRAEFLGPTGQYTLTWTVHGLGGDCTFDVIVDVDACATLDFDGLDDNVTFRNDFDLDNGPFSIEIWVKPDANRNDGGINNAIQTILSKRDETNLTHGYDLRLTSSTNIISFNWNNGNTLASPFAVSANRWYHVAVTFSGGTYRLYIDGIEMANSGGGNAAPINNNFECIMGAMDQAAAGGNPDPVNYYSGWLDELRIWNVALSPEQIRHMMNQEIEDAGGSVLGRIVPINIPGLTWANLDGYFRMNQAQGDIAGGYVLANAGTRNGQMRKIVTWQQETAPLPYDTDNSGNWYDRTATTPWLYGDSVWDYPNAIGVDGSTRIDWNIVRTSHNVDSDLTSANPRDVTVLGLIVNPASKLTITASGVQDEINTGHGLWVTHYLRLDGMIDLVGESQLVQKRYTPAQFNDSFLDVNSSGYLERDQQGTTNRYNYNYWSPPVGPQIVGSNNNAYSVDTILLDGTNSSIPNPLFWTNGYDSSGPTPITLSNVWIWTYENYPENVYAEWSYKAETGMIAAGLGYTMKGSNVGNPSTDVQNYVFTGKPRNATISNPINGYSNSLVGNPYPSALDAQEFIRDNIPGGNPGTSSSIDGTLYFWIHYDSNLTHILRDYQGGYATYNLSGGLAAVTAPLLTDDGFYISGQGSSTLTPERYIPVGQGFFVSSGDTGGGDVTFENDQRYFRREVTTGPANDGSQFLRSSNPNPNSPINNEEDNLIKRVRLDFESSEGATRPLLLAFVPDNKATDGFDYGYDAKFYDSNSPSYMAWTIDDNPYVIQGVGDFDKSKKYPFAVNLDISGRMEIALTAMENFDHHENVYVYDALLDTYTKINNSRFKMVLDAGEYLNRFFIAFTKAQNKLLDITDNELENSIVNYLNSTDEIYVQVPDAVAVKQVYLINIIGQTVRSWNITNMPNISNKEFRIPVENISGGTYIIKVETNTSTINKKIIITY